MIAAKVPHLEFTGRKVPLKSNPLTLLGTGILQVKNLDKPCKNRIICFPFSRNVINMQYFANLFWVMDNFRRNFPKKNCSNLIYKCNELFMIEP